MCLIALLSIRYSDPAIFRINNVMNIFPQISMMSIVAVRFTFVSDRGGFGLAVGSQISDYQRVHPADDHECGHSSHTAVFIGLAITTAMGFQTDIFYQTGVPLL